MDDVSESLKETIKTRLSNPLWGYIALSWLGFNWQNIAILFMSNEPVQFRIMDITSKDHFYTHYLIAPIVAGFFLAIISPYLQLLIAKTHIWAQKRQIAAEKEQAVNKYDLEIALAQKKVEADKAKELALAIETNKIIEQEEIGKREKLITIELENKKRDIEKEYMNLSNNYNILDRNKKDLSETFVKMLDAIEQIKTMDLSDLNAVRALLLRSIHPFDLQDADEKLQKERNKKEQLSDINFISKKT